MGSDRSSDLNAQTTSNSSTARTGGLHTTFVDGEAVPKHPNLRKDRSLSSKSGIALALIALVLTVGQYYQSGIEIRNNITQIWKEGYSAETRNRVARFTLHYNSWKKDPASAKRSLDILIKPDEVFNGKAIRSDENLKKLLESDYEMNGQGQGLTDKQYVDAALNYRNAILECLNTMEAVKAVIRTKPRWISNLLGNADRLEERYEDLIIQRTGELHDFIYCYRSHNERPTPAWSILTDETSNVRTFILVTITALGFLVYLAYRRRVAHHGESN